MNNASAAANGVRIGAGSPSYDSSGNPTNRLFSKRAREIQAEEGVTPSQLWGSVTSPTTPLRERESIIPETQQSSFPEPIPLPSEFSSPVYRRARAGTVPSRFSPVGLTNGPAASVLPTTTRPSPAPSPFKPNAPSSIEIPETVPVSLPASAPSVASRLRSGSLNLPPRSTYVSPLFGSSVFPSTWSQRERNVSTSSLVPSSPAHSSFSKEDESASMRTLDYLGLADTPQPTHATLAKSVAMDSGLDGQRAATLQPFLADMGSLGRSQNRFRSYSVNAKEKYAEEEEEEEELQYGNHSGQITPSTAGPNAMASMRSAVAAYGNGIPSRPRARTAGILESPPTRTLKNYVTTPSRLDAITNASDLQRDYFDITNGVDQLQLANTHVRPSSGEGGMMSIMEESSHVDGPTRSLWLGNIPASTTISSLNAIFQTYGPVESSRVLTHKNCGFVNFERIESAIQSRNMLNGKEIFPGAGPVRIGFAKVQAPPGSNGAPTPGGGFNSASPDPFNRTSSAPGKSDGGVSLSANGGDHHGTQDHSEGSAAAAAAALELPVLKDVKDDILSIVREFGADGDDFSRIAASIDQAIEYNDFREEIPAIPEPSHNRIHDAPKLREFRKRIDNNSCTPQEIEEIAKGMLSEIAELSSDYLGNTVVQKLFEFCSEDVKEDMLDEIAPHLAEIGIHKNGTWAGQKIIDVARTSSQMHKIVEHLRPYAVALFLDQYGNYVLQCCLRFNSHYNDFIFETMLSRMWEIAQGRFGARAMRACLESHHASKDQQRMLAAAIALHSVQLASNANGALLLTWFLDTCTFPKRRSVLAPRLVPHLVHLCTHKVAYLTVLKVINQRNEPEARDAILRALFFSPEDKILEDILQDNSCGATLIFKVLTTPFFDESLRSEVVHNVRSVLIRIDAQPSQGYKRLMEEVGLPTRNGSTNNSGSNAHSRNSGGNGNPNSNNERSRGGNSQAHNNNSNSNNSSSHASQTHQTQQAASRDFQTPYYPGMAPAQFDPAAMAAAAANLPRTAMDPAAFIEQLALNNPLYAANAASALSIPQLQYQAMLQQAAMRPTQFYPPIPAGPTPAYATSPGSQDQFRAGPAPGTPVLAPQMQSPLMGMAVPQGFGPLMAMGGYGYPPVTSMPVFPQQSNGGANRRGGGRR